VTGVEGYRGLVVHGPLIATLLAELVRHRVPEARLTLLQFRAVRPVFDIASFNLRGTPSTEGETVQLWTDDHEGWLTTQASVELA
jgi:3-methylfumaryl-CoA hydratase